MLGKYFIGSHGCRWRFSLQEGLWRRSAWDIGLGLAAASFSSCG
ncbi:hypothetical protein [Nostoc sp. 'Peltigera malacea cyanobiont' DB3992]